MGLLARIRPDLQPPKPEADKDGKPLPKPAEKPPWLRNLAAKDMSGWAR